MGGPRQLPLVLVAAGVAAVALFGYGIFRSRSAAKPAPPAAAAVAVARVQARDLPISINALGQAQGWQTVVVRAQIDGKLLQVPVAEGSEVAKGTLIAEIDPAPFRAALMQAQGALGRDQAQLNLAKLTLTRYKALAAQDSISGQDVDSQEAQVNQYQGVIMLDQGAVAAAQVNLNYTRILAPISGRVGVRLVDAGNLVSSTDTGGIITINQISPIAVTFTLPQGEFQRLSLVSEGFRTPLVVRAYSQESSQLLDTGELVVVDNRVDPSTATMQLKARFANERHLLWPGQLVNVKLTLQIVRGALTLPSVAVNQGPSGPFTYVIENNRAVMRPLVVDIQQDEFTVIKSGVQAGELVVVEGQGSLRPGAAVSVRTPRT